MKDEQRASLLIVDARLNATEEVPHDATRSQAARAFGGTDFTFPLYDFARPDGALYSGRIIAGNIVAVKSRNARMRGG